jgi:hypothetical protein
VTRTEMRIIGSTILLVPACALVMSIAVGADTIKWLLVSLALVTAPGFFWNTFRGTVRGMIYTAVMTVVWLVLLWLWTA